MTTTKENIESFAVQRFQMWQADWRLFARECLGVNLDTEQEEILRSVQFNPRTSVASGTARGKDFVAAVSAMCFMYLTPKWNEKGELIENTKVAMTAPTGRQVDNIMIPEISRLYGKAKNKGFELPGRLRADGIRTESEEWFLTAFKASEHQHEAWSGFHAVNTMFIITEASGISDDTFAAIEGNLQGNSRILLVFNPNITVGYAAKSQKGERWSKFRLNSLTAPNIVHKKTVIPGQVDYAWIKDKLENWCTVIQPSDYDETLDDFQFEGVWYRPEDLFRVKILGKFPKVSEDSLIPEIWIELAQKRWKDYHEIHGYSNPYHDILRLGVDVAGMGRDSSCKCYRFGNIVKHFKKSNSGGVADHMKVAGEVTVELERDSRAIAMIDTIGEGAGVYSRSQELPHKDRVFSCKYSESATNERGDKLTDVTGQYTFANMRAWLFWAVRDWLNPKNNQNAMLPPGDAFTEEATEIKWKFQSNGSIIIEPKEDIKDRLGRSTDEFDSLANTFYPAKVHKAKKNLSSLFR